MLEHVSSVYLDTPGWSFYNRLLGGKAKKGCSQADREAATLFRIRKYQELPHLVWIELKTYRCTDADPNHPESIKERVALLDTDIGSFLTTTWGHVDAKQALKNISTNGASGKDRMDEEGAISLLLGMQHMIQALQLQPCVETKYSRMAFTSKSIRITLDWNIVVGPADQHWSSTTMSGVAGSKGQDDTNNNIHNQSLVPLPFCILEIKLPSPLSASASSSSSSAAAAAAKGDAIPPFLHSFLRNGILQECPKFSKFMTAVAIVNKDNIPSALLPYWMNSITRETGSDKTISDLNQSISWLARCQGLPIINSRL